MSNRTRAKRRKFSVLALVVGVILVAHVLPIVMVVVTSFSSTRVLFFPLKGFGFTGYIDLFDSPEFFSAFQLSLVLAALTGVGAVLLGVPASFALVRYRFRGAAVIENFLLSPLMVPTIAIGIAMVVLYSQLGIPKAWYVVFIGHMIVAVPYVARVVTASLVGLDRGPERAARSLGASPVVTFFRVTLPMVRPGIIAGLVFAFIVSWEEVNITAFVSGLGSATLPVEILNYVSANGTDSTIAAMSALLLVVGAAGLVIVERTAGVSRSVGSGAL